MHVVIVTHLMFLNLRRLLSHLSAKTLKNIFFFSEIISRSQKQAVQDKQEGSNATVRSLLSDKASRRRVQFTKQAIAQHS